MPEFNLLQAILYGIVIGAILSYMFGTIAYMILNTYYNGFWSTFRWASANATRFFRAVTTNFQSELPKSNITCDPKFFVLYTEMEKHHSQRHK